jgi:hypothetical protein
MAIGGIRSKFIDYVALEANGASGSAKTIDWSNGNSQKVAMTDNCTFTFTNPLVGLLSLFINNNDALGPHTPTWPATVLWANNTPPTFTVGRTCVCTFRYEGTNYYADWSEYY